MVALAIKTMEIVAAKIDGPHPGRQGAMCGAGRRQARDPAGHVLAAHDRPTSKAKASAARHFVVTNGRGFISGAAEYPSDFCKIETESARERAYIRHRSPALLGTQVL